MHIPARKDLTKPYLYYHMYICLILYMKEEAMVITKEPALDTVETCITKGIHRDTIRSVKKAMPDPIHLYDLADLFKLFGGFGMVRLDF